MVCISLGRHEYLDYDSNKQAKSCLKEIQLQRIFTMHLQDGVKMMEMTVGRRPDVIKVEQD
jgi:hypothetical protein